MKERGLGMEPDYLPQRKRGAEILPVGILNPRLNLEIDVYTSAGEHYHAVVVGVKGKRGDTSYLVKREDTGEVCSIGFGTAVEIKRK
ncbi:hypothetical protein A2382_01265 [Candidatus Woesebacteria bacterium RIFOXYB1_FULL_38_16]|uniref:Uncharacterized protein n=1 Tax=Candidatus Woesebacteria bacterium RIFOXYB1_FULL_38_16 TaxID=1802538 RepID=A0A1F8CTF7_9BACT|nr:MAG: hypothetical protein A2191_00500 [Candidatus Woesebacteria bacterium RIFOXYA1_FULL_38_9]OGM79028.1 MAG: hypothetical protein A2382_01265 [Candidatus Woesebacteria bacterium RIFOXYB1_FULL_38_16]